MQVPVQSQLAGPQPAGGKRRGKFSLVPYLFILPHFLFFASFIAYPFLSGIYISLFRYDYLQPATNIFVGLQNYSDLFTSGTIEFQQFWYSLGNTLQFVLYSVPLLVVIPLVLALLLNTNARGITVFRTIYFAPWVLSVSVTGLLWWWIFQSEGGLVNYYLAALHLNTPAWLSTLPWAWIAIVVATIWWTAGFNMIILLAALQNISTELYEAGAVDGANRWQLFWNITLPLLRPMLLFIVIISIIASFNLFGQPYLMTQGGPAEPSGVGATTPVMYAIYNEGFVRHYVGSAAAMSFLVAIIMITISYANFRIFRTHGE